MKNREEIINNKVIYLVTNLLNFKLVVLFLNVFIHPLVLPNKQLKQLKRIVSGNFSYFFPEWKEDEIEQKSNNYIRHLKLKMQEDILLLNYNYKNKTKIIERNTIIENAEVFSKAISQGKGILLVGSHVGSILLSTYSILHLYTKLNKDHPGISTCIEPDVFSFRAFTDYIAHVNKNNLIQMNTINTASDKKAVAKEMIQALLNNRIVTSPLDVAKGGSNENIFSFFNKMNIYLPALVGITKIAVHTNSIILPWVNYRDDNNKLHIAFEEPIQWHINKNRPQTEKVQKINNELFSILENWIQKFPDQWVYWDRLAYREVNDLQKN